MTLGRMLRAALARNEEARPTCFGCAHFRNDCATIESALPGISSFSSSRASVRADDGVCDHHDVLVNGRRACGAFTSSAKTMEAGAHWEAPPPEGGFPENGSLSYSVSRP